MKKEEEEKKKKKKKEKKKEKKKRRSNNGQILRRVTEGKRWPMKATERKSWPNQSRSQTHTIFTKNAIYYDKTQLANFRGKPPFSATEQH